MPGLIKLKIDGKDYDIDWQGASAPTSRDVSDIETKIRRDNQKRIQTTQPKPKPISGRQAVDKVATTHFRDRNLYSDDDLRTITGMKGHGQADEARRELEYRKELDRVTKPRGGGDPNLPFQLMQGEIKREQAKPQRPNTTYSGGGGTGQPGVARKPALTREQELAKIANDPNNPYQQEAKRKLKAKKDPTAHARQVNENELRRLQSLENEATKRGDKAEIARLQEKQKLYSSRLFALDHPDQASKYAETVDTKTARGPYDPKTQPVEHDRWLLESMPDDQLREVVFQRNKTFFGGEDSVLGKGSDKGRQDALRALEIYRDRIGIARLMLDPELALLNLDTDIKQMVSGKSSTLEKAGSAVNVGSGLAGVATLGTKDVVLDPALAVGAKVLKKPLGKLAEIGAKEIALPGAKKLTGKAAEVAEEVVERPKIPALRDEPRPQVPAIVDKKPLETKKPVAKEIEPSVTPPKPESPIKGGQGDRPTTAAKNESMAADRKAMGLDELPAPQRKTFETSLGNAQKQGLDKSAHSTAQNVLDKPRALSDEETAGMALRAAQIKNSHKELLGKIDDAITKGEDVGALRNQLDSLESEFDTISQALKKSGTEAGRALASRKLTLADDYSLVANVQKAQAKKGSKLTEAERTQIEGLTKELEETKLRVSQLEADAVIKRLSRGRKYIESKEALAAERAQLVGELKQVWKESAGRLNANPIPVEALPIIGKLAVNAIKEGAVTIAEVVTKLRTDFPDLQDSDVYDAIKGLDQKTLKSLQGKEIVQAKVAQEKAEQAIQDQIRNLIPETRGKRLKREIIDAANLPRSLMATADMSYFLRQGLVVGTSHPVRAAQAFGQAVKAYFSKNSAESIDYVIRHGTGAEKREAAGLYIAPLNHANLTDAEETFMSRWAEKIPGYGHIVQASQRHFVTGLNKLRADVFDDFARRYPDASEETLRRYADFLNKATGRGDLGKGGAELKAVLNATFFSPRLVASRFQTPYALIKNLDDPIARKEIAKDLGKFMGFITGALTLAKLSGAEVNLDPNDSDFLKIKVGNTRTDILAGFQQPLRALLRIAFAHTELKNGRELVSGKKIKPDNIFEKQKRDPINIAFQFLEYKASPTIGLGRTLITGENAVGEKQEPTEALIRSVIPLFLQDLDETMKEQGYAKGAAFGAAGFLGAGVSTYDKSKK